MGPRQTGIVAKWLNNRGIGFITPDGQETTIGKDLLVHHSQIQQKQIGAAEEGNKKDTTTAFKILAVGSRVEFDTAEDPKNPDKLIATNVTGIRGVDCDRPSPKKKGAKHYNSSSLKDKEALITVLVHNLPKNVTWRELKDYFRNTGYVDRVDVRDDNDDGSSGDQGGRTGIVRFSNEKDADGAIQKFNGSEYHGNTLKVCRA
jgi:cold shock CspA family protein